MISNLIGAGIAASIIYSSAKYQPKEVRKINRVFNNVNYRVGKLLPRIIETRKRVDYIEYIFEVPPGLIDDIKLAPILTKTLRKPVRVLFDGILIIRAYKSDLPTRYNYDWQAVNNWRLPIGLSLDGVFYHDFDVIPHMTVAGATRQGKSVLLKLILAHLVNSQPENAELYILDLKGGMEFGKYRNLSQVKGFADDIPSAETTLRNVVARLKSDISRYAKNGYTSVFEANDKRRIFIITDEAAELADSKTALESLSEITRIGGALGYRNIFATQYPTADTLPRQVKQNSDARISFRLPTEVASRVAIDEGGAELLANPGRAIYRTHERHVLQVPFIDDNTAIEKLSKYIIEKGGDKDAEKTTPKSSEAGADIIDISGFNLRDQPADWRSGWPRE